MFIGCKGKTNNLNSKTFERQNKRGKTYLKPYIIDLRFKAQMDICIVLRNGF